MELGRDDDTNISARSLMPPFVVLHDFLEEATVAGLLDHALPRQSEFAPTQVRSQGVAPSIRVSTGLHKLGGYRQVLKAKLLDLVPKLISQLQVTPIEAPKLETELVAHGDGAFYKRHIDTHTASDRETIRVLSGVYYFHAVPKAFSGGALRLYAIGGNGENYVDIEPVRRALL